MATRSSTAKSDEAIDPALPQKRRARRRLIGAGALCLLAALLLPWVFDSEPRIARTGVQVSIPSRDTPAPEVSPASGALSTPGAPSHTAESSARLGRAPAEPPGPSTSSMSSPAAVPPLAAASAGAAAAAPPLSASSAAPPPAPTSTPSGVADKTDSAPKTETRAQAKPAVPSKETKTQASARADPSTKPKDSSASADPSTKPKDSSASADRSTKPKDPEGKTDPGAKPRDSAIHTDPAARSAESRAGRSGVVLQAGAYASEKAAADQVERLRKAGQKAFTEKVKTDRGDRIRVRVGPYPTREAAEKARAKLKAAGIEAAPVAP